MENTINQNSPVYCEIYQNELATIEITYGLYSEYRKGRKHYKHNLCSKTAKELWDKCSILINQGEMHWSNKFLN